MEEKIINRIIENYQLEFYENKDFQSCLTEAKKAYELLEKDQLKNTKEEYYIYITLLTIIRCKIILQKNKTKKILKYITLGLYYSQTKSDKMFIYYLLGKYHNWTGNNKRSEYYFEIVNKYEAAINKKGCFSKTYNQFINMN